MVNKRKIHLASDRKGLERFIKSLYVIPDENYVFFANNIFSSYNRRNGNNDISRSDISGNGNSSSKSNNKYRSSNGEIIPNSDIVELILESIMKKADYAFIVESNYSPMNYHNAIKKIIDKKIDDDSFIHYHSSGNSLEIDFSNEDNYENNYFNSDDNRKENKSKGSINSKSKRIIIYKTIDNLISGEDGLKSIRFNHLKEKGLSNVSSGNKSGSHYKNENDFNNSSDITYNSNRSNNPKKTDFERMYGLPKIFVDLSGRDMKEIYEDITRINNLFMSNNLGIEAGQGVGTFKYIIYNAVSQRSNQRNKADYNKYKKIMSKLKQINAFGSVILYTLG